LKKIDIVVRRRWKPPGLGRVLKSVKRWQINPLNMVWECEHMGVGTKLTPNAEGRKGKVGRGN
jgi:hypothetical protein